MANSLRFLIVPSLRCLYSRCRIDDGNALLGFLAVAPLVCLLLVSVLEMACVIWTREVVAEQLRMSLASSARVGGSLTRERESMVQVLRDAGIELVSLRWNQESLGGGEQLFSATLEIRPRGVALLPTLTTTVSTTAIKE